MKTILPAAAIFLALSGCNTPYPNGTPIGGAEVSGNPYRRGTPEFCRNYARQTAANRYEANEDDDGSLGADPIEAQRARNAGGAAYRRCLAGRTG